MQCIVCFWAPFLACFIKSWQLAPTAPSAAVSSRTGNRTGKLQFATLSVSAESAKKHPFQPVVAQPLSHSVSHIQSQKEPAMCAVALSSSVTRFLHVQNEDSSRNRFAAFEQRASNTGMSTFAAFEVPHLECVRNRTDIRLLRSLSSLRSFPDSRASTNSSRRISSRSTRSSSNSSSNGNSRSRGSSSSNGIESSNRSSSRTNSASSSTSTSTSTSTGEGEFSVKMTSRGIVRVDDPVESLLESARTSLGPWHKDMVTWRRAIHAQPELAFQEDRTSDMVAQLLTEWGYTVDRSLGGTGVVGTLSTETGTEGVEDGSDGSGKPHAIILRADMDALPIEEHNQFDHRSRVTNCMHACGHDGHTAMLLGAARQLAEKRNFAGTLHLVFQPAEEGTPTDNRFGRTGGGALAMLQDGLLEKYPVRAAFGMHNWPGLATGRFAIHSGPVMAGVDNFDITVHGEGCHAGMPHLGGGRDPLLCASFLVGQLQSIVSRTVDPCDRAVVSATQFHAGDAYNVIPPTATIRGTIRTFSASTRQTIMDRMTEMATNTAKAHGCTATVSFRDFFPATVNTAPEARECAEAALSVAGAEHVDFDTLPPSLGAEDFGYILERTPGCYIWIGNGPTLGGCMLHNPLYDFNDDILALGAAYWVKLAEQALPKKH